MTAGTTVETATETEEVVAVAPSRAYQVEPGDTVRSIAQQFGVETVDIIDLNGLTNPDRLEIGSTLQIGAGRASVSARGGERSVALAAPRPARRAVPLDIPFYSQLDGSYSQSGNCGPASLAMAMGYFGEYWSISGIRKNVNDFLGAWAPDTGSSWGSLEHAARRRDFDVVGLYGGSGFRRWTLDDLAAQTEQGRPVLMLVRYWSLPGHGNESWYGDHYIVFLGFNGNGDAIYHDPAFPGWDGAWMVMSKERLTRAWTRTYSGLQYSAMALRWPPDE